jgi:hypothetical protein
MSLLDTAEDRAALASTVEEGTVGYDEMQEAYARARTAAIQEESWEGLNVEEV